MSATSDAVKEFLTRERSAIRNGDYSSLPDMIEEKARLFVRLSEEQCDEKTLASLKEMAEHNGALLEAAQRGLGAALGQIGAARSAASPQTYGPKGERDRLGPGAKKVEKRY